MADPKHQPHTEPPSGRILVFEKNQLVGSFAGWREAVAFIRANHIRAAILVPESREENPAKRSPSAATRQRS